MFGYWYNSSFRRYITLMGALFSNINVKRVRKDKEHYINVPISYGAKEKFFSALMDKYNIPFDDKNVAKIETILPRMNLSLIDVQYNPMKKTAIDIREKRGAINQFNPVPYRLIFELGIYTRYEDDVFQIVEQILPYFQPHFNCRIQELHTNDLVIDRDIKISLQTISPDQQADGDPRQIRHIEWSIIFNLDGYIYPPIGEVSGEIRTIYVDFFDNLNELLADNFESVDTQVSPEDVDESDWDGSYTQEYSANKPIPKDPEKPKPRKN